MIWNENTFHCRWFFFFLSVSLYVSLCVSCLSSHPFWFISISLFVCFNISSTLKSDSFLGYFSSFFLNMIFHYERENFSNDYQLNISQLWFSYCCYHISECVLRLIACEKYCVHLYPLYFLFHSLCICIRRKSTSSKIFSLLSIGKSLSIQIFVFEPFSSIRTIEPKRSSNKKKEEEEVLPSWIQV